MLWPLLEKRLNDFEFKDLTIAVTDYLFRAFLVMITCMLTKNTLDLNLNDSAFQSHWQLLYHISK
jgi:hypothetical protein